MRLLCPLQLVESWIEEIPQFPSPGPDSLHVDTEEVLVRGGGDGQAVELLRLQGGAGDGDVLPGQELIVWRPVELDLDDVRGQDLCLQDVQLHVAAPQADYLVQQVDDAGEHEEHPELWRRRDPGQAMHQTEHVQEDVELVGEPEEPVGLLPDEREGEDEDDDHEAVETDACQTSHGLKEPVADVWSDSRPEEYLPGHALEVVCWLGAQLVEVHHVGDGVDQGEEEGRAGADLVELEAGVQGDVLVQGQLLHLGDQVLGHGQQEEAVAEGEGGG